MNEVIKALCSRASCNKYKPDPLTREEVQPVIEAGLHAASGRNAQGSIIVAVTDPAKVRKLAELNKLGNTAIPFDTFYGAPCVLIVLAKRSDPTYLYDGSLVMGSMLAAAQSLGLGARWIHRAKEVFDSDAGKALLHEWGIEGDYEGIGNCIIGHPDMELIPKPVNDGRVFYVE